MIEYRSEQWYQARAGIFTASGFYKLMAKPADKSAQWSKTALNYIRLKATEKYTGNYAYRPDCRATLWGTENEQLAINAFAEISKFDLHETGFIQSDELPDAGATPDVIFTDQNGKKAIAQIKCPYNNTFHKKYCDKIFDSKSLKKTKSAYFWQMQGEMWVTGVDYSYFISFDKRYPKNDQFHFAKISRDDTAICLLKERLIQSTVVRDSIIERYANGTERVPSLEMFW
jgi:hypothetical protein